MIFSCRSKVKEMRMMPCLLLKDLIVLLAPRALPIFKDSELITCLGATSHSRMRDRECRKQDKASPRSIPNRNMRVLTTMDQQFLECKVPIQARQIWPKVCQMTCTVPINSNSGITKWEVAVPQERERVAQWQQRSIRETSCEITEGILIIKIILYLPLKKTSKFKLTFIIFCRKLKLNFLS